VFITCNHGNDCTSQIAGANAEFGGMFVLNRADPTRIAFAGINVYTTQDTLSGANGPNATTIDLLLTDLGNTGSVSAMAYGAQDNVHALIAGTSAAQLYRSLTAGGAMNQLTQYGGDGPAGDVVDKPAPRPFFVGHAPHPVSATNARSAHRSHAV